jgi:hypothetical protein
MRNPEFARLLQRTLGRNEYPSKPHGAHSLARTAPARGAPNNPTTSSRFLTVSAVPFWCIGPTRDDSAAHGRQPDLDPIKEVLL